MAAHERFNLPDRAALLAKIAELGLDIPYSDDVGVLLEPIDIGGRTAPNRCAIHPMEGRDAAADGAPGELTFRRYARYAAGGAGLIWFEATAVAPAGRASPKQLMLTRDTAAAFGRLVEATRRTAREAARETAGTRRDPLLILQLTHAGRYAAAAARAPTPVSDAELDRLQETYEEAADLAAGAGFDGVDVKACHGYLVSELLAAIEREDSRYGGSFDNRARFLIETVRRIRRRRPGLIVASRINAFDDPERPGGFGGAARGAAAPDLAEARELACRLAAAGAPLLSVSAGIPHRNPHVGRPFNLPAAGGAFPREHPLEGVARLIAAAAEVQAAAPVVRVAGAGYSWLRHHAAAVGAGAVKSGRAAFVGVGRGAFAYPDWVRDLMERGSLDPNKVCIACSGCTQIMRMGLSTGCVVRDREIYAPLYRRGQTPRQGASS